MMNVARWRPALIALVLTLGLVGLMAYARGPEHHRGDEIGSHGTKVVVIQPSR